MTNLLKHSCGRHGRARREMGKDEGAGEADDREISLSFATEFLLWSTVIVTTLAIEASTLAWLPAFHVAAGLLLLRASALVEHQITNVALNLDIEVRVACEACTTCAHRVSIAACVLGAAACEHWRRA